MARCEPSKPSTRPGAKASLKTSKQVELQEVGSSKKPPLGQEQPTGLTRTGLERRCTRKGSCTDIRSQEGQKLGKGPQEPQWRRKPRGLRAVCRKLFRVSRTPKPLDSLKTLSKQLLITDVLLQKPRACQLIPKRLGQLSAPSACVGSADVLLTVSHLQLLA